MRFAFNKERLRVVGIKTSLPGVPFIPERTPVVCADCGEKAWAVLTKQEDGSFKYVSHCLKRNCIVKDQIIITEPIEVK